MPGLSATEAAPRRTPSYRARLRSQGPPIAFLNTQWGRDEMAGKHAVPALPLRHKPSTTPLRSCPESPSDGSRAKRSRPSQTVKPRVSYTRDEELAYVVQLRRPRPVIQVDVCVGKKHARRTPSPPPARTIKRKRGFTDGRSLAREGQQHGVHFHHKSPATTGSEPGLSPSRSGGTTPISSLKTPSPGAAPARTPLGPRSGSWQNSERRRGVYYETEYRYPRPVHQQRPSNVLNAGLHPIDTGSGTSKQKRREGVALVSSNARAYGDWLEQEYVSEVKSRSGRMSLGFSKLLKGSGMKEEMNKRMRRRGKGFGVFEWSPFS